MGGVDGIGEAVTGAAFARAVEPAGGRAPGADDAHACLNCRTPLVGLHCHQCGQPGHVHRTIAAWWHDLAHGVLHLDGKIWRTLPLLALWPGELTRRYVEGERARFVSPLALFLFATFLMFAVLSLMKAPLIGAGGDTPGSAISQDIAKLDTRLRALEAERADAARRGGDVARIDAKLEETKRERNGMAAAAKYMSGDEVNRIDFKTGWPALDRGIEKSGKNPSLLFYKMQANAYKFSWALIPLSLPFLWMLFLHRRRYRQTYMAYDHVVFITYSISFMSLGMIALVLLTSLGVHGDVIALAAMIIPPVHIYRQLRGAYRLRRRSALWRTAALLIAAQLAIGLFFMLLLALGVLG